MKKFFLSMLALASMAGVACAQEVVATYDFTKMREYPWGVPDGVTLTMENQCLNASGSGWWQFKAAEAQLEPETDYTITMAIKASKKGATAFAVGNWSGDDFFGLADDDQSNKITYDEKWAASSCTMTTRTANNPLDFMFQPGGYDGELNIAWVVISKGHCEPESTPLMPISLDNANDVTEVNFSTLGSYDYDGASAELVDGVLVATGDDVFNVMEGLKLEPELDYGVIAKVKASADVEVGVSLGDWGAMVDGSFLGYDVWNEVVIRLGNAPVDDETGLIPENCFVMFSPEDDFAGTIEVEWVKLVYFVEPEPEPEPVYKTEWSMAIDDLTGDNGESDYVWSRTGEVGAWTDAIAPVCDNPDGEGKVFYADVPAHPLVAEGEEDPIPDHHVQFFVQYPDNMFKVGDIMKVKFDYYSTVERRVDTQSHYSPGDYILWHFIGTFTAKPEWQTFTAEVVIDEEMVGSHDAQGCIAFNLCTKEDNEGKPESIFYMNHITIERGEQVLVSGEEPVLEWQSIITNGNANDGSSVNVLARVDGNDSEAAVVDNPAGEGKVFEAPIVAKTEGIEDWTSQMFIEFNQALEEGTKIKVSFDYYSSNDRTVQTQAHGAPGSYHYWDMLGNLEAKPEWQSIEKEVTITADQAGADGCKAIAFNLSTSEEAGTFYINNVKVEALLEAGTTAVEEIEVAPVAPGVESSRIVVYNLLGVKVLDTDDASQLNTLKKGIYIVNGKKVAL
ncbi:MAG: hypothetical protein K2J78_01565 [Muribaculaceae bacterium]|nr:hypothetical protein [Muribaculaceae bacterium]